MVRKRHVIVFSLLPIARLPLTALLWLFRVTIRVYHHAFREGSLVFPIDHGNNFAPAWALKTFLVQNCFLFVSAALLKLIYNLHAQLNLLRLRYLHLIIPRSLKRMVLWFFKESDYSLVLAKIHHKLSFPNVNVVHEIKFPMGEVWSHRFEMSCNLQ